VVRKWRRRIRSDAERGAAYFEYMLLVSLIAVACIVGITFLGKSVDSNYSKSYSHIANVD
jgi:Flp pilus assembly pilin Flp